MSFSSTYRANGKLLLTGEYLVLHGAKAIAMPLKVGQQMVVSLNDSQNAILWKARFQDKVWFECKLNPDDFGIIETSDSAKSDVLERLFKTIKNLDPDFVLQAEMKFETMLESNPEWGLGSSSTLVSLLAQYAGVDPFTLNEMVFQGSGFDIACASANGPILYSQNRMIEPIQLDYPFSDQLFLIYSGQKKKTAAEVGAFLKEKNVSAEMVSEMSALTDKFTECRNQEEFNLLIRHHENLVSKVIGRVSVKPEYFSDFNGEIKSLGAWGGDFLLASANKLSFQEVRQYFENKGLTTVFKWGDLILKRQ